jgi:hypothetical protein
MCLPGDEVEKGWLLFAVVALRFPTPFRTYRWSQSTAVAEVQAGVKMAIHIFEPLIETVSAAA